MKTNYTINKTSSIDEHDKSNKSFTNLVSFSNEDGKDSVWIGFQNLKVYVEIQPSTATGNLTIMTSSTPLSPQKWQHVAFTLKSGIGSIYYNGVEQNNAPLTVPIKTKRNFNFVGQDYYNSNEYSADAIYQNLNLYKGALTADEVMTVYQNEGDFHVINLGIFLF